MAASLPKIQLLQASADPEGISEFRILVDGKSIKFLTIDHGLYDIDDLCFEPVFITLLPPLPSGDWNEGHISRDPETGLPHFVRAIKTQFPGVTHLWHALQIDYLDVEMGHKLRSNVYEATNPRFPSTVMIAKFARFPWEVQFLEAETRAYEWLQHEEGIGPRFLGHLSEEGRVIGFLIEFIPGCRHADVEDLALCQAALSRLHRLGIKHGDINKHNFLIRDGKPTLIDFEGAVQCDDTKELEEEFERLSEELRDVSGRGGSRVMPIAAGADVSL